MKRALILFTITFLITFLIIGGYKYYSNNFSKKESTKEIKTEFKPNIITDTKNLFIEGDYLYNEKYSGKDISIYKMELNWKDDISVNDSLINNIKYFKKERISKWTQIGWFDIKEALKYFDNLKYKRLYLYTNKGKNEVYELVLDHCEDYIEYEHVMYKYRVAAIYKPVKEKVIDFDFPAIVSNLKFDNPELLSFSDKSCNIKQKIKNIVNKWENPDTSNTKYMSKYFNNNCYIMYVPNRDPYANKTINSYLFELKNNKLKKVFELKEEGKYPNYIIDFQVLNVFVNNKPLIIIHTHIFECDALESIVLHYDGKKYVKGNSRILGWLDK